MPERQTGTRRTRRRRVGIGAAVVFGAWALVAVWLLGTAWYAVPAYAPRRVPARDDRILTAAEYGALVDTHPRPFVVEVAGRNGGRAVIFGAEHTRQPQDPQLAVIRTHWEALAPTVALVEGDLGMLFPRFMDPVRTFGETGYVHLLARGAGIETYSWEPPVETIVAAALAQGFSPELVALRWILNPYFSNLRHGRPEDPEAFVEDTFAERCSVAPIANVLTTMDEVQAAWDRAFPSGPDWRDVSDQFGLPGELGAMDLNAPRDVHLVACVAELVDAGERVFVVCGSSHAVRIAPALMAHESGSPETP
jgi:hypothetical protein